jgi:hypothetical protein
MMANSFPDARTDNKRFSGSAVSLMAIILIFVLFLGLLGIVGDIQTTGG